MLQKLFFQFQKFSSENIWIYAIFLVAICIVVLTGTGNIFEIFFLFILNIFGNICFMLMLDLYQKQKFPAGAISFALGSVFFIILTLYGYIKNGEIQYLLWQLSFVLGGLKNVFKYCVSKELFFINPITVGALNVGIFFYVLSFTNTPVYGIIQSLGFAIVTVGLILNKDLHRYFVMLFGTSFILVGSFLGVIVNFLDGELLGITLSFALLTFSTFMFYLKLFPSYISQVKKS